MPNYYDDLPEVLWHFTVGGNYDPLNPQDSLKKGAGAGHHGSHAHLVHEFVMSCTEERKPWIDEHLGGNITAAGICAHESALKNGEPVSVVGYSVFKEHAIVLPVLKEKASNCTILEIFGQEAFADFKKYFSCF